MSLVLWTLTRNRLNGLRRNCVYKYETSQNLHTSTTPSSARFRNPRKRFGGSGIRESGRTLLDKYVKHLPYHGSISVRAPFNIEVKGSYFDRFDNIDDEANSEFTEYYRRQNDETKPPTEDSGVDKGAFEKKKVDTEINDTMLGHLDNFVSRETRRESGEDFTDSEDEVAVKRSPLHVLLYGASNLHSDSFSVVNESHNQHHTYVYLTDCDEDTPALQHEAIKESYDESVRGAKEAFVRAPEGFSATANISLYDPLPYSTVLDLDPANMGKSVPPLPGPGNESFANSLRFYSFNNILESPNAALRALCLVPTSMSKIILTGEQHSRLSLDGTLIEALNSVGLTSDMGQINIKDVTADYITLAARYGDIVVDGIIDGHIGIDAENESEVHMVGKAVFASQIHVRTQEGDMNIKSEVYAKTCNLITTCADISVHDLRATDMNIFVGAKGDVNGTLHGGKVKVSIAKGNANINLGNITSNSVIHVACGEVNLQILPEKPQYKLRLSAPMTNMSPKLQNSGELSLCTKTGNQVFTNENSSLKDGKKLPLLTVQVDQGVINVAVNEKNDESNSGLSLDTVTETLIK